MPRQIESAHQQAFFQWVRLMSNHDRRFKAIFAIPNGGARPKRTAAVMVKEGVEAGVLDICVAVPQVWGCRCYGCDEHAHNNAIEVPGLFIEMKAPGREKERNGGLSPLQVEWKALLEEMGYEVVVAYGFDQARSAVCEYLGVKE